MKRKASRQKSILAILLAVLAPQPTYALGGSPQLWANIFSFAIIGSFLTLAFFPWLSYRAINNGNKLWTIITIILCTIGIYFSFVACSIFFDDRDWIGQRFFTNLFASSAYIVILFKALQKATDKSIAQESIQSENLEDKDELNKNEFKTIPTKLDEFVKYQNFSSLTEANGLADLLRKNNIPFLFEDHSPAVDIIFSNTVHEQEFRIKLKKTDFKIADEIQADYYDSFIQTIDKGYYLFDFTDQELVEITSNPEDWSRLDYLLAHKILKERKTK